MSRRLRQINEDALVAIRFEYPTIHPSVVRTVFQHHRYNTAATCAALDRQRSDLVDARPSWLDDAQPPPYDSSTTVPISGYHRPFNRDESLQQPQRPRPQPNMPTRNVYVMSDILKFLPLADICSQGHDRRLTGPPNPSFGAPETHPELSSYERDLREIDRTNSIHPNGPVPWHLDDRQDRLMRSVSRAPRGWNQSSELEYFDRSRRQHREIEQRRVPEARAQRGWW